MVNSTIRQARKFARECMLDHEYTEPPLRLLRDSGLVNWWLPKGDDGTITGLTESVDIVAEIAYADAGAAFTLLVPVIATTMITLYGTDDLRKRVLGGGFLATAASEHTAGSELDNVTTTVANRNGRLEITGEKMFSTNAAFADHLVVIARCAESPLTHRAAIVQAGATGMRIAKRWNMSGLRSAGTYQVSFNACPVSEMLDGPGLQLLEVGLNPSRVLIAATAVGIARRIRDLAMDYARSKRLRGEPLARNAVFAAKLGQMAAEIDGMRNHCLAAAAEIDALMARQDAAEEFLRRGALRSALTAKLLCGQTGWRIADTGSQLFGGLGYTTEVPIARLVHDMRYISIVEGGDDVLRDLHYRRFVIPEHLSKASIP